VPFVRFSRDRRGYEHTYLVHDSAGRGKPSRIRVLYWFRTPPGVKVGRQPFDDEARQKIELQNPGVSFDWNAIVSTSMPPIPEVEHWRERRRVERAAKVARRAEEEEPEDGESSSESSDRVEPMTLEPTLPAPRSSEPAILIADLQLVADLVRPPVADTQPPRVLPGADPRRRRRRRGGRRRQSSGAPVSSVPATGESTEPREPGEVAGLGEADPDTSED
jgi:hypothetical protein